MNNRFKYRVWDNQLKKYNAYDNISIKLDGTLQLFDIDEFGKSFNDNNGENCIIEQCTGLKDRNDRFIYEGDIVRIWDKNHYIIGQIQYEIDDCRYYIFDKRQYGYPIDDKCEIIGNIHKNEDFLHCAEVVIVRL